MAILTHPATRRRLAAMPADARPQTPTISVLPSHAIGRKTSDEFVVPLCRTHHRQNHQIGDELFWRKQSGIDPLAARRLWEISRGNSGKTR